MAVDVGMARVPQNNAVRVPKKRGMEATDRIRAMMVEDDLETTEEFEDMASYISFLA